MTNLSLTYANPRVLSGLKFRSDINFLRIISIISVVMYHFMPDVFTGGFVGVDIFFVVSGFLMTKIIITSLNNDTFSFSGFFLARFRRIAPALLGLCLILIICFWFWMPKIEYKKLGSYLSYVVLFISNVKFNKEAGNYFSNDSNENWFLHTWSLSVEWQFYLLLPLSLYILHRFKLLSFPLIPLAVAAVLSFQMGITYQNIDNSSVFYLFQYRAWEMLCGGIAWLFSLNLKTSIKGKKSLSIIGYLILFISIAFIKPTITWPGYITLVPVAGAMLSLCSGGHVSFIQYDKCYRWIGLSSYSTYLWHWPVVVLLTYAGINHDLRWVIGGIFLSFFLGVVSWIYIEKPSQRYLSCMSKKGQLLCVLIMIFPLYSFALLIKSSIITNSPDPFIDGVASAADNKNYSINVESPGSDFSKAIPAAIIIGDSHAVATTTALEMAAEGKGNIIRHTFSGCPLYSFGTVGNHYQCETYNQNLDNFLLTIPKEVPLIIVNRNTHYIENKTVKFDGETKSSQEYEIMFAQSYLKKVCALSKHHHVYIVRPIPEMDVNVPRSISHSLMFGRKIEDVSISYTVYKKKNNIMLDILDQASKACGIDILDASEYLCKKGVCSGSKNLQPLYFDDNHLNERGNKILVPMFRTVF